MRGGGRRERERVLLRRGGGPSNIGRDERRLKRVQW